MTGTLIVQILCVYIYIYSNKNEIIIKIIVIVIIIIIVTNYIKLTHVPPATWKFPYDTYRSARLGLFQQGLVDSTLKNIPNGGWIM